MNSAAAANRAGRRLVIVGGAGGTNVGSSLREAAGDLGLAATLLDLREAMSQWRIPQAIAWHLAGRRPLHLKRFSRRVEQSVATVGADVLIATGGAPVTRETLERLRGQGVATMNFSTDDPFNPAHRAPWHLEALAAYATVFTPRRSNVEDLRRLGCKDVRYLPFGFDPRLFAREPDVAAGFQAPDILFVGGADPDRAAFFAEFMRHGPRPALAGAYWDRFSETQAVSIGHKSPTELRGLTVRAAINLCLVRRANRDGHVMRTFEIPACGGFMVTEDTAEHREILGPEGECTLYFRDPAEAAAKCMKALDDPDGRRRMMEAAHARIVQGGHTYEHRLATMLERHLEHA